MEGQFRKKLVPISQAAEFLGVSIDTIRRWDEKGVLHSERPNGKDRYFAQSELEKIKFSKALTISEAANRLGISEITLRRLENKDIIKPDRDRAGNRIYTLACLEKFIKSEYFLRRQEIEEKILSSPETETTNKVDYKEDVRSLREQAEVLACRLDEQNRHIRRLNIFKKIFYYGGLTVGTAFILTILSITVMFFISPRETSTWLGFKARAEASNIPAILTQTESLSSLSNNGSNNQSGRVLGIAYQRGDTLSPSYAQQILKPFGVISLGIVHEISPAVYEQAKPETLIGDVNDIFAIDQSGSINPRYNFSFPDTTYLKIPDTNLIKNLNADYIRGKVPGESTGNLAYFEDNGLIPGLKINSINIDDTSITDNKIQSSNNWNKAYNHISNYNNPHDITSNQVLPDQTGQTGKVLGTDGTDVSWVVNSAVVAWGSIGGVLANQADLNASLNAKENAFAAGLVTQYLRGDKSWATLNATVVGLGNVENTALSTWAGSVNITTLGTIGAGTWNATAIADGKISSSGNWNTAFGWGNHALAGYFVKAVDDLDDVAAGIVNVHLTAALKSNYDAAYSHKTTEDAVNGLVKVNGAGVYSAVTDNSTNWDTAYTNRITSASGTAPLTLTLALNALTGSISDAVADGATKGVSAYTANDFDALAGVISIDYTNGQAASAGAKGFLTSADWSTFNSKQASGNYITGLTGDVTATGPGSVVATIASGAVSLSKMANLDANTIIGNNTGAPATPLALSASDVKTLLLLNNVENTALSTWAGSTNITTLGTVGTGTWNATVIADGKIASALTGKTYNGLTITTSTGTLTIADLKTLTASNTLTLTSTDGATLAIGGGGTLGTGAYATIGNYALVGQTMYIGTTQVAINRASAALTLAGLTLTTPDIGVATATSIAIGANTLDTNEWAFLDGQDQAVKTTSSPTFAGGTFNGAVFFNKSGAGINNRFTVGSDSASHYGYLEYYRSRGTVALPTTLQSGDYIGGLTARPYDGTDYLLRGSVLFVVDGAVDDATNAAPTKIIFQTGTTSNASTKLTIGSDGTAAFAGAITANIGIVPDANDGAYLGTTALSFSDLFLAEGGVINWDNGDATLTQVGDVLTLAGADFKIANPGNVSTSALTTDGAQSITGKTMGAFNYAADAGANDTYAITLSPVPAAYTTGMIVVFKANTVNTGAASLNVNALGAKTIVKRVNTTLADADIAAGQFCTVVYDGTNFVLMNPTVN